MNEIVRTSAFKTGNSVAVRLPKAFGIKPGDAFDLVKTSGKIELKPVIDPEHERQQLAELIEELRALGPIPVQAPEEYRIEFPDRPGLYD